MSVKTPNSWTCLDALIVGAGPAGSAAALVLAQQGWRVAITTRASARAHRIVETLPPASRRTLQQLGVWNAFVASGYQPSVGTVSWWEDSLPIEHDSIFHSAGGGLHVDRWRFDRLMVTAAVRAGASLLHCDRIVEATARKGTSLRQVRVRLMDSGQSRDILARFLINASGRAGALRSPRYSIDCLVGLAATLEPSARDVDRRPWIEATPSGWWYSAPGIDGSWSAVFFTDADLVEQSERNNLSRRWSLAVAESQHTAQRLKEIGCPPANTLSGLQVTAAGSYFAVRCRGDWWLAAGDAAAGVDPLCGQGIERALRAGMSAGETIGALLAASDKCALNQEALDRYEREQVILNRIYLEQRLQCYGRVRRWADRPFWRRRIETDGKDRVLVLATARDGGEKLSLAADKNH